MEVEAESFARRLFVPAETPSVHDAEVGSKKRYAQLIQLEDTSLEDADEIYGSERSPMGYEKISEIDITGMEYVRSDTADATQCAQKEVLAVLLSRGSNARSTVFERARGYYDRAKTGETPLSDLAKRGGIGQPLSEYGSPNRRPSPIYRGAKYADKHLDVELSEGDKPLCYYVEGTGRFPSVYDTDTAENGDVVDAVALPQGTPLPEEFTPNREKHVQKAIVEPLEPILETMNWSWSDVKAGSVDTQLSNFM
jgi:DNA polymerase I